MGNICSTGGDRKHTNRELAPDEHNRDRDVGDCYMIVIALDYPGTGNELTCTKDGDNMMALWQACGHDSGNIVKMYNNDGNKDNVMQSIQSIGGKLGAGDTMIFYYSGHGTSVDDVNGDEADGKDEALCTVTADGKLDWDQFITDDELAEAMIENVPDGAKVIILSDCCHSGTITDFDSADWGNVNACAISGCEDDQTSGDTGNGGIFTHSMLCAIAAKAKHGQSSYSVGQLYNQTLNADDTVFDSKQNITCSCSDACGESSNMTWPLVPGSGYQAPMGDQYDDDSWDQYGDSTANDQDSGPSGDNDGYQYYTGNTNYGPYYWKAYPGYDPWNEGYYWYDVGETPADAKWCDCSS